MQFETVLLTNVFLRIFAISTPLSEYLQTSRLDYAKVWNQVEGTTAALRKDSRDFESVHEKAVTYVASVNSLLENSDNTLTKIVEKISVTWL